MKLLIKSIDMFSTVIEEAHYCIVETGIKGKIYKYKADGTETAIYVSRGRVIIKRSGAVRSSMLFSEDGRGDCSFNDSNIYMDMKVVTKKLSIEEKIISIEYEILQEDERLNSFFLVLREGE